jgi:hypothetical protein
MLKTGQPGCRVGATRKTPEIWNPIPGAISYADVLSCSTLSCWAELVRSLRAHGSYNEGARGGRTGDWEWHREVGVGAGGVVGCAGVDENAGTCTFHHGVSGCDVEINGPSGIIVDNDAPNMN